MSTQSNKEIVRRYYDEALTNGRVEVIEDLAIADYIEHDPLPGQGEGLEGLKNRVTMLVQALAPAFTLEDVIAEDDRVVVRWTNNATHVGTFAGIPATGRSCRVAGIGIHRLVDGRMAEHWHVVDQLSMLQQLGLLPTPEGAAT
ncbi:MAG: ester cyclase [Actinomycetota bacterium]|nr:ester cyclase [Actinomycetota bacterium]